MITESTALDQGTARYDRVLVAQKGRNLAPEERLENGVDGFISKAHPNERSEETREEVTSTRMTMGRMDIHEYLSCSDEKQEEGKSLPYRS